MAAQLRPSELGEGAWAALGALWRRWLQAHATGAFAVAPDPAGGRLLLLGQRAPPGGVHALVDAMYGGIQVCAELGSGSGLGYAPRQR